MKVEVQPKDRRETRITLGTETEGMVQTCSKSDNNVTDNNVTDNNVTDKIDGIQTEDNKVKGAATFIDVVREARGRREVVKSHCAELQRRDHIAPGSQDIQLSEETTEGFPPPLKY
jgi:hypothetical protein